MINEVLFYRSDSFDPFFNQAVEIYLLEHVKPSQIAFYLWQNERTVLLGRNQDAARESSYELLESEGGYLSRRHSGGGAVFYDVANLNFTFLAHSADFDVRRQAMVIVRALENMGLHAELSGRNDITIDGYKFSGNAYYKDGDRQYHHGTLMVDVDTEAMARYLKPSKKKLASKGVSSVRSRVGNLIQFKPDITIDELVTSLRQAVEQEYQAPTRDLTLADFDAEELEKNRQFFTDDKWRYGVNIAANYTMEERYNWGEVQIRLDVKNEEIENAQVLSDANDSGYIRDVESALKGVVWRAEAIRSAIEAVPVAEGSANAQVGKDIADLIVANM
ncbi:MAG: lipoate--protein ligase [Actinomycetaceae bacterium]|nr:lipoate--protein ligase [Actinomycetaceae bacterium]MDY6082740.1 lipoate--protein ligase [Actinomycetaceae bacterium]